MTHDHNLAKTNHTKPNQDILGQFIGLFDPFLGQKYWKPIVKDFKEYRPLKYIYVGYIFHFHSIVTLLTTCAMCKQIQVDSRRKNMGHSTMFKENIIILKYIYVGYIFHFPFWGNSLDLVTLLTTCDWTWDSGIILNS